MPSTDWEGDIECPPNLFNAPNVGLSAKLPQYPAGRWMEPRT